ncbi:bromodomain protein [Cryptosporidium ryanae]|uniref:bromodomain protein n=1 Tax=Cryptosporidium ryanae TaxID=515981 RepID=UPI00351A52BB|nr:bromodomain protein [Cryptosporidium ryanae]
MNITEEKKCLRSEINGLGLNRGELNLTLDELRWIQLEIGPEYGFIISPFNSRFKKSRKSKERNGNESEIGGLSGLTTQCSNKRQRTSSCSNKAPGSGFESGVTDENSINTNFGVGDAQNKGKLTRKSLNMRNNNDLVENSKSGDSAKKKLNNIDLAHLKLIDFKQYSLNLLDKLSKNANARWFLQPVDPELDGVPDYFSIIENPMDFQTIREKLVQNMYKNPFGWQLDMRLVFYNALKYHREKNTVRQDTLSLAIEFENKCKEIKEINPYYYSLLMETENSKLSDDNFVNELKNKFSSFNQDVLIKIYKLITNNYDKKKIEDNTIDIDIEISPELIVDKLKSRSDVFQEQIVLLADMIVDLNKKRELINNNTHINDNINDSENINKRNETILSLSKNSNERVQGNNINKVMVDKSNLDNVKISKENKINYDYIIQDDENIAMTPSSDECSDLDENIIDKNYSKKNDYYKNENTYLINEKEDSGRESNINNSEFNSSEDRDGLYSNGSSKEIINSSFSIPPQESAWGEWKAKVIQDSTVAQRENAPKKSKREREAEQADAEI